MSAFLGPIHYWLYNKILLGESLQETVLSYGEKKGISKVLREEAYDLYGQVDTRPLEDVIETGNIHGWLHNRIGKMEGRLAFIITHLVKDYGIELEDLKALFYESGYSLASKEKSTLKQPMQIYEFIFNHLVEGMPCDRVNELVINTLDKVVWKTTQCVHKAYWENEKSNVEYYYALKDAWIQGVVDAIEGFEYIIESNQSEIRRK